MQKPDLPFREDFYYQREYNLESLQEYFFQLLSKGRFQPEDKTRIREAYHLAESLHEGQSREKEDPSLPFIIHPLEVAIKLLEIQCSPDEVIAGLLHDIREDVTKIRESENQAVAEIFRSRVVEVLTRLLSKYRIVDGEIVRLSNEEYFKKLAQDMTATMIKAVDRRTNLMSCGRMLDYALDKSPEEAREITAFVRKQIDETFEYVLPLVEKAYTKLAQKLEIITARLETRLQLVENYLTTAETTEPASAPLASTLPGV